MLSNENTFPLGSFLYLAEKHSKDICRCSSARQQSLQTEVAPFSKEHITVYRPRWKPSRSTALPHPLPSTTTLQSSGLGLRAPTPLEQDDITLLCLHCTHHKCWNSQPDPSCYWTQTKPGMLETIKQQMQQKWINLHLNKSKSQRKVKDNNLWRQSWREKWYIFTAYCGSEKWLKAIWDVNSYSHGVYLTI